MVFQSYKQFIEGLSITKPTMIAVLIANIVNAGANYIFIYGNFGFPALGLDGAGIATFISRLFMAAALVWYCLKKSELQIYRLYPRRFKPVKILIVRLLRLGIPAGFQSFFETSAFSISAILVGWIGTAQLAAHQIALSLASISFLIVLGISSAAAVRVGNEVGREDIEQTRKAGFSALFITVIIMTIAGCSFILFRSFLVSLFIDNPAVLVYAEKLLLIAAAFQIFDGIQATGMGILRGLTDVVMPSLLAIISYWLIGLPVSYIMAFVFDMGVEGVWYGFLAGLGIMSLLLLWRFNRQSRKIVSYHNDYYPA
jgi:MATE family multidrug resistance protein